MASDTVGGNRDEQKCCFWGVPLLPCGHRRERDIRLSATDAWRKAAVGDAFIVRYRTGRVYGIL
jgi:hypothetical protein